MPANANFWLRNLSYLGLTVVVISTLFLFWNLTSEFYETPKFIAAFVVTAILFLILALKFVLSDRVTILRTPLDLPLLLLVAVATVSSILSPSLMLSIFGHQPTLHTGLASIVVYVLFYLFLVNSLNGLRDVKFVLHILIVGGIILSILTLLSYFGIKYLPAPWSQGVNFTPTGSSFSTAAVLSMLLPYSLLVILASSAKNIFHKSVTVLHILTIILFGITIVLTGNFANWVACALGLALVFLASSQSQIIKKAPFLMIPLVIVGLIAALSYIQPMGKINNPFYEKAKSFPRELQAPFVTSWKVSVSSFRDHPFWGSGPDSGFYSFTSYKPLEYNNTKLWNIRFDTPFNEYFGTLANLGGLGLFALLLVTFTFLYHAIPPLISKKDLRSNGPVGSSANDLINTPFVNSIDKMFPSGDEGLKSSLSIAGIVFFTTLALYPSSLVLMLIGIIILASFMAISPNITKPITIRFGASSNPQQATLDILPSVILLALLGLIIVGSFNFYKHILADIQHRQALTAVTANQGVEAYNKLIAAEKLSPWNDLYHTDLAQVNFALASAIASRASGDAASLTDQDKTNIQTLLQQAIDEGKVATTVNPRNVVNWEVLAAIYRQISGVAQNALAFALDSYGRAIQKDPFNPVLRLNVGGVYYAVGNYDLAIRFFTDAVNLKPDWPNAYYNLAVALRDKGDTQTALTVAQKVVELLDNKDPENADYKTAMNLIKELEEKTGSSATLTPPAAAPGGALEKDELPKVLDLPEPENIATPPAVKK